MMSERRITGSDGDLEHLLQQLKDLNQNRRRSAAKKLRKLKSKDACSALQEALTHEAEKRENWETQYQMIMALAESGCGGSLPLIRSLMTRRFPHQFGLPFTYPPVVRLAIGDALARLAGVPYALREALRGQDPDIVEGAVRAAAMTQAAVEPDIVESVLTFAEKEENRSRRFWVAAAAPGWSSPRLRGFLEGLVQNGTLEEKQAATAAIEGRYLKWNPL